MCVCVIRKNMYSMFFNQRLTSQKIHTTTAAATAAAVATTTIIIYILTNGNSSRCMSKLV
jgi:hypothetical protein